MAESTAAVVGRIGIYRRLLGAVVRGQAVYRASFALDLASNAIVPMIELATILAVFHVTRTLGGFDGIEVVTMYGLAATAFSLGDLAVGNIERIRVYARLGTLDAVLVRPLSVLGQLVALDFATRRVTRVAVSSVVLVLAANRAGVEWTPARLALAVSAVITGSVFFGAVFVATATVAFWWVESGEFANGFTYGGRDFASYPVSVYSGAFRILFAYTMGFAFVAYGPVVALLDRPDPVGLPGWLHWWGGPLVAVAAVLVASVVWRTGVRHYRSTGS